VLLQQGAMANHFCDTIEDLIQIAIKNRIPITTLLSINGLTFDTTSENTGKTNGICAQINDRRKILWNRCQSTLPEAARRPYEPLLGIPCCDHVASLMLVHFMTDTVNSLRTSNLTHLVQGDRCIIVPVFESFGNLLSGEDGDKICSMIQKDGFKTALNISFQNVDPTRYLALPVLIEKFFEFEKYIEKYMESMLAANEFTETQKRYWILWKTTPLLRGIGMFIVQAKNQYMQPLMRVGNSTHSWKDWKTCLEKTLNAAAEMKHSRCWKLSDDVLKSFPNLNIQLTMDTIRPIFRSFNVLLGNAIIFILNKWYGDIISSDDRSEKWIVATNRESERFISLLKICLEYSRNIREVIINAYLRLRFCKFSFAGEIPDSLHAVLIKEGRAKYDNHITRKKVNTIKKELHDKVMEVAIAKFAKRGREQRIFMFMCDSGAPVQLKMPKRAGKDAKMAVTVEQLKEFLGKLKRRNLYNGEQQQRVKDDYFAVIERVLMPQGAAVFRAAYNN
jgi:hypothetical protein